MMAPPMIQNNRSVRSDMRAMLSILLIGVIHSANLAVGTPLVRLGRSVALATHPLMLTRRALGPFVPHERMRTVVVSGVLVLGAEILATTPLAGVVHWAAQVAKATVDDLQATGEIAGRHNAVTDGSALIVFAAILPPHALSSMEAVFGHEAGFPFGRARPIGQVLGLFPRAGQFLPYLDGHLAAEGHQYSQRTGLGRPCLLAIEVEPQAVTDGQGIVAYRAAGSRDFPGGVGCEEVADDAVGCFAAH